MAAAATTSGDDRDPHYPLLVEQHPDAIFQLAPDGRFLSGNASLEALTGRPVAELRELSYADFVDPVDVGRMEEHFGTALRGERRTEEVHLLRHDGQPVALQVTTVPIVVDDRVVSVYGIARDVSDQVAAEAARRRSEKRFRGLFQGAGVGIAVTDLEGSFVEVNPAYQRMLGYTAEELEGTDLLTLTHPDDRADNAARIRALLAGEVAAFTMEKRYVARDGRTVWARASVSLIRDADGRPTHMAATAENMTAARLADERLERSERLRRLAGRLAGVGGWSVDARTREVYWSEEVFAILELGGEDAPDLAHILDMYADEDALRIRNALEACLTEGVPFDLELSVTTGTGRVIPVRSIGEPDRDEDGRIRGATGAFQDISDLRAATERAEDAAQRLMTTLESMTDALFTLDTEWCFTYLNGRAAELLQRDREELLGHNVWEEFPAAVGGPLEEAYRTAMATGETQVVEESYYAPLDTWFSVNAYPSAQGLAVYFRDVTSARESRRALQERESVLRRQTQLLDDAQDAIIARGLDNRITYWNRGAERAYGWTAEEVLGADVCELLYVDPATFDAAKAALREHGRWSGEMQHRNRAGEVLTVDARWTLVPGEQGEPASVLAINTDVTERRRIEQQLLRAQRMESLGTLAGGVAHDLNNVLSPVLLAAELLQDREPDPDERYLLETIASSARRGADLVSQVLSFARGVEGQRASVDLGALLEDLSSIVRDTFPKDVAFKVSASAELGEVIGDSTQIQQVLLNLAVNARDAMPDGGTISVTASRVRLDAQYVAATPGTTPGDYLLLEVEDNGTGMPPEVRDRVFEPFFTTKPHGVGTGLGLSTSAAIVESHGGFLHVYSEVGAGTRFHLYLPASESLAPRTEHVAEQDPLPRGQGQGILVVDDEPAVRTMTRHTLEAHGYRVHEAGNGAEAVSVFVAHRDQIAVVLTDMMMPIMDGPATIHALQNLDPAVRIIGSSGLHANGKVAQASHAGVRHFLPKPYSSRHLLEVVADILAARD